VDLPFEQDVNAFVTEAFEHGRSSRGLHHFVLWCRMCSWWFPGESGRCWKP
jgi:hypothetical protein